MPDSFGLTMSRRSFLKLGPGAAGSAIPADPLGLGIDASSLLGILFLVSGPSTGAAAIALVMAFRRISAGCWGVTHSSDWTRLII
jgi:hypothetical protein